MPGLTVPTLIVRGAQSHTLTPETCRAALSANGSIRIATVENATHLVPLESPSEVFRLAQQFLGDVLQAPPIDRTGHRRSE
jgi:pimeloyl-ACP methyl ester carboxylesterase